MDAEPFAKPGRMLAYHAVSGGFILGEIVHQVTGKDIRTVLAESILDPLGFRWTNYGVAEADLDALGTDYVTGPALLPPASQLLTRALGVPLDQIVEWSGDRALSHRGRARGQHHDHRATSCRASSRSCAAAASWTASACWSPRPSPPR